MNSKQRFMATLNRQPVDRPASWIGVPDPESLPALIKHFGAKDTEDLKRRICDDGYALDPDYHSPTASAIYAAFDWYGNGDVDAHNRTLTAPGYFHASEDLAEVEVFDWPDPALYMNRDKMAADIAAAPRDKALIGMLWSAHLQDTFAAFGMETCLINMYDNPELVHAVNDRVIDFYLKANEIFYQAAAGRVDCVLIGNDVGGQQSLMLSQTMLEDFLLPGCRKLVDQAHQHGVKVIYHSCGAISDIIPQLIEAGVDAIHPIQALARGMDAESIHQRFAGQVSFCGGVDTQRLLVNGSPEAVTQRVMELRSLFPTGLILSPSHEAVLPDIPPENIRAMLEAAARPAKG